MHNKLTFLPRGVIGNTLDFDSRDVQVRTLTGHRFHSIKVLHDIGNVETEGRYLLEAPDYYCPVGGKNPQH